MRHAISSRLHAIAGGLPATFWYVFAGSLVNKIGGFVVPFLALYLTGERGMTPAQAGVVVSLYGAGAIGAGPVGGLLTDRLGRRAALLFGLVAGAAGMLSLGFASSPVQITVAAVVLGFAAELFRPAVAAIVADVVPPDDRTRAYGLLYWAANLGFAISPVLAGYMSRLGYLTLFVADAATTLVYAAIVFWKVPETRRADATPTSRQSAGSFAVPLQDGVFLTFAALSFITGCLFFQSVMTMPVAMGAHGIDAEHFGQLIAVNGLLITLLQPFVTPALARFRRSRVLAFSAVLIGVGFGLTGFVHTPVLYALAIAVWTLGEVAQSGTGYAVVSELAPPEILGRYQGVFHMSFALAAFAGPAVGGLVLDRFGEQTLFGGCGVLGLALAVGHIASAAQRQKRLEQLSAGTGIAVQLE